jgi:transcriptional regulator with XRE-family HTH domain
MDGLPDAPTDRRASFSKALKALRRRRGLPATDVAEALGMSLRSYEYFESGHGRLNILRVHEVARILKADPFALLIAVDIGSPEFAVRSMDNKLAMILLMAVADFDAVAADQISLLEPATLIAVFRKTFAGLVALHRDYDSLSVGLG